MTDTATTVPADHAEHDEHHPSDRHYVVIAIWLAVITGAEVTWSYIDTPTVLFVGVLGILMGIKFFMVASQFMHLKFDNRILSRLFYGGLFLAVGVYLIALFTFRIFNL